MGKTTPAHLIRPHPKDWESRPTYWLVSVTQTDMVWQTTPMSFERQWDNTRDHTHLLKKTTPKRLRINNILAYINDTDHNGLANNTNRISRDHTHNTRDHTLMNFETTPCFGESSPRSCKKQNWQGVSTQNKYQQSWLPLPTALIHKPSWLLRSSYHSDDKHTEFW